MRVMEVSFVPIMSGSSINAIGEFELIGTRYPSRVQEDSPINTAQEIDLHFDVAPHRCHVSVDSVTV